ncbi:MAG: helix-turn-helix domain-containing protein [bacterium]|nr:helix-turn-helix domain-containing protein [bacterium]MCM1376765.1 helix-turn-helix domain-containing protein [Muribaculum sp.]
MADKISLLNRNDFPNISERCRCYRSYNELRDTREVQVCAEEAESAALPDSQDLFNLEERNMPGSFSTLLYLYDENGMEYSFSRIGIRSRYNHYPGQGYFHRHKYVELFYVVEGSFEQILLGERHHFEKGEIVITDQNCEHADYLTGQTSAVLYICLAPEYLDSLLDEYETADSLQSFLFHALSRQKQEQSFLRLRTTTESYDMERLMEQLVQEDYGHAPGWEAIVRGNLIRLFSLLCTDYTLMLHSSSQEAKEKVLVYELERYIRLHRGDVTAGKLEEVFHYHRNYFNLLLKKYRGIGFREYVQKLRVEYACELLKSTSLPVRRIAAMTGYTNNSFFYRMFQKYKGISPGDYRVFCRRTNCD